MLEAALDAVRAGMRGLRAPGAYDAVHKDECAFSFHTPFSTAAGLLLNLHTLRAVSDEFLAADHQRTGHSLYLRMQYTKVRRGCGAAPDAAPALAARATSISTLTSTAIETLTCAWPRAER
jgi:hypothetical protein